MSFPGHLSGSVFSLSSKQSPRYREIDVSLTRIRFDIAVAHEHWGYNTKMSMQHGQNVIGAVMSYMMHLHDSMHLAIAGMLRRAE